MLSILRNKLFILYVIYIMWFILYVIYIKKSIIYIKKSKCKSCNCLPGIIIKK